LVLLVAALSLLAMPVTYSGGAEEPHAHVFFQVWIDAAYGSFDHHHADADAMPHHDGGRSAAPLAARAHTDSDGPTTSAPTAPEVRELALAPLAGAPPASRRVGPAPARPLPTLLGRTERPLLPPPRFVAA
jgi:hypothetical protein